MAKNPTSKTSSKKKKTAAAKKNEGKKTKTSKKSKAAPGAKAKAGAAGKSSAKAVTLQELLARRFTPLEARTPVKVSPPDIATEGFSAPPFFEADNPAEAERLREVLGRRFDYEAIKAAAAEKAPAKKAPAKKAAAKKSTPPKAPAKPVTTRELLARRFAPLEARAPIKVSPPDISSEGFSAPPFFEADSPAEAERLREVLGRRFDYEAIKAAAEKAAAEKAAAEKAAAEKAAAEKAAAEKAAAEKAAAEKAAAEKAAAEKAAAEKAAARKAAAEKEPKVAVSYDTTAQTKGSDPMGTAVKAAVAGFVLVLLAIIATSVVNSGKYYLQTRDGVLEIWQGHFAPLGEGPILTLPGVAAPEPLKDLYTKKEVFPLASQYYMDRADDLLAADGVPDYEAIQAELEKAGEYAVTDDLKSQVASRLTTIELMTLLYRAEVAASRGTPEDLAAAVADLEKAARLNLDDAQAALVQRRLEAVKSQPPQMIPLAPPAVTVETAAEAETEAETEPETAAEVKTEAEAETAAEVKTEAEAEAENEPAAPAEEAAAEPQAETAAADH